MIIKKTIDDIAGLFGVAKEEIIFQVKLYIGEAEDLYDNEITGKIEMAFLDLENKYPNVWATNSHQFKEFFYEYCGYFDSNENFTSSNTIRRIESFLKTEEEYENPS